MGIFILQNDLVISLLVCLDQTEISYFSFLLRKFSHIKQRLKFWTDYKNCCSLNSSLNRELWWENSKICITKCSQKNPMWSCCFFCFFFAGKRMKETNTARQEAWCRHLWSLTWSSTGRCWWKEKGHCCHLPIYGFLQLNNTVSFWLTNADLICLLCTLHKKYTVRSRGFNRRKANALYCKRLCLCHEFNNCRLYMTKRRRKLSFWNCVSLSFEIPD